MLVASFPLVVAPPLVVSPRFTGDDVEKQPFAVRVVALPVTAVHTSPAVTVTGLLAGQVPVPDPVQHSDGALAPVQSAFVITLNDLTPVVANAVEPVNAPVSAISEPAEL